MDSKKILTTALHLPESATDVEIGHALADLNKPSSSTSAVSYGEGTRRVAEDPQGTFHSLAERLSKAAGISLGDAYARVSQEAPAFYLSNVRDAADLNRVML